MAQSASEQDRLLKAGDVAALFGVHVEWVYDRAKEGVLPSYRLGRLRRFRESEVWAALASWRERGDV